MSGKISLKHFFASLVVALAPNAALAQADLTSGTLFSSGFVFEEKGGAALYSNICQGCHMANAKGATGAGTYPALAGNPRLASPLYPATIVLMGLRSMPAFGDALDDQQIADVVNYVRSHFGNHYKDKLTAAAVKKTLRPPATAPAPEN